MVAAIVGACYHCGHNTVLEWDDDLRRYVAICFQCRRVQPAPHKTSPVIEEGKVNDTKTSVNGDLRATRPIATPKPDSSAAKALETYHATTTRYLEASEKLRDADARIREAQERATALEGTVATAKQQMGDARAQLDHELSLLTPTGEPKPFSQRVKVRAAATLPERACKVCGTTFQPLRVKHFYCSDDCRHAAMRRWHREHPNGQGSVVVEASEVTA
jgi:hypothetical protein